MINQAFYVSPITRVGVILTLLILGGCNERGRSDSNEEGLALRTSFSPSSPLLMFDPKETLQQPKLGHLSKRALKRLRTLAPGAVIRWDQRKGTPIYIKGPIYPEMEFSHSREIVNAFVWQYRDLFGIGSSSEELKLLKEVEDRFGVKHYSLHSALRTERVL